MATPTGTPTNISWGGQQNPAATNITIPADANRVVMFWSYYVSTAGQGLASATLAGNAPTGVFEVAGTIDNTRGGLAYWDNPPTGTQSIDVAWDASPGDGPACTVFYISNADVANPPRDMDAANPTGSTVQVTLDTQPGDLVVKFDTVFSNSPPGNTSGWTSAQTQANARGISTRTAYLTAAGTSQLCPCENESFSVIVAISMAAAGGGDPGGAGRGRLIGGKLVGGTLVRVN